MSESAARAATATEGPGFFGKVRTHGDFVTRRLPAAFVTPWDACLQEGMLFAQKWFGAQWLPVYLNAPVWCFALGAGICGESVWAGVLMPGVDRVGRYFPFTIAAPVACDDAAAWLDGAQSWYDEAARRALSTLADDFVLERFDAELDEWGPLTAASAEHGATTPWRWCAVDEAQEEAQEEADEDEAEQRGFSALLAESTEAGSGAWWTQGSSAVPASLRSGRGLPDGARFVGLLDDAGSGWKSVMKLRG